MDLKHLRTFNQVARMGSLSRAAESLHIAQPALGRQIQALEEHLNAVLFERHPRGMTLTPAGQLLLKRASAILRLVEETRIEVSATSDAVTGTVSLGVPPTAGDLFAASLVERASRAYPQLRIRIVPAFTGYLLEMLHWGEIDLAVMYLTDACRPLHPERLFREQLQLVGSRTSRLAQDKPVKCRNALQLPLILPGPRHGLRDLIDRQADKLNLPLRIAAEADSLQTLKDLVQRGLGYTVLPIESVHRDVKEKRLTSAPLAAPRLARELALVRSPTRPDSVAVRVFTEQLRIEITALVQAGRWRGQLLLRDKAPLPGSVNVP